MKASLWGYAAMAALVWTAGCGSDGNEKCTSIVGTWTIDQHCESSSVGQQVSVTQSGCFIFYTSPFDGWKGKISGNSIGISGPAGSEMLSCTGTVTDTSISVSCPPVGSGSTCNVALTKQGGGGVAKLGGACTAPEAQSKKCDGAKAIVCQSAEGNYLWGLDSDCGSLGQTCVNGKCEGGTPPPNVVGKACTTAGDCPSPHFCNQAGFCTANCTAHADCGCPATGTCANTCVQISDTDAVCFRYCQSNADCAVGTCQAILKDGGKVCAPPPAP
jgi:hypothetical protein